MVIILFVCLSYFNNIPVGVMLVKCGITQAFVRKSMRRNGIGTMMAKHLKQKYKIQKMYGGGGIDGSDYFFSIIGDETF